MNSNYDGYYDIQQLKRIPITLHKFFEELPENDRLVIVIGLGASDRDYLDRYSLSDALITDGVITALNICWGEDLKIIEKDGVGLFWIDVDEIASVIFEATLEEHLSDLFHRTIIRCLEGERLGEKGFIEKKEGDNTNE